MVEIVDALTASEASASRAIRLVADCDSSLTVTVTVPPSVNPSRVASSAAVREVEVVTVMSSSPRPLRVPASFAA